MSAITPINDKDFDSLVIKSKKTALVFFSATWSRPSQVVKPVLEQTSDEHKQKLTFYNLDTDKNSLTPAKYGVNSLPTIILFVNGEKNNQLVGIVSKQKLSEIIGKI